MLKIYIRYFHYFTSIGIQFCLCNMKEHRNTTHCDTLANISEYLICLMWFLNQNFCECKTAINYLFKPKAIEECNGNSLNIISIQLQWNIRWIFQSTFNYTNPNTTKSHHHTLNNYSYYFDA